MFLLRFYVLNEIFVVTKNKMCLNLIIVIFLCTAKLKWQDNMGGYFCLYINKNHFMFSSSFMLFPTLKKLYLGEGGSPSNMLIWFPDDKSKCLDQFICYFDQCSILCFGGGGGGGGNLIIFQYD